MDFGFIGPPSLILSNPDPIIFVPIIILSLILEFFLIQFPIIFSVFPAVSFLNGEVGYISAVSKKLIPQPRALSICKWASASVVCSP